MLGPLATGLLVLLVMTALVEYDMRSADYPTNPPHQTGQG